MSTDDVTHLCLVVAVAPRGDILRLEDEGGGAVGHGLGEAEHEVLPLPVRDILLADGVENSV